MSTVKKAISHKKPVPRQYNLRPKILSWMVAAVCKKIGDDWNAQERAIAGKQ